MRESLVYNKYTAQVVGFTKIGDLNDQFEQFDANHILGVMVGVFNSLRFP